MATLPNRTSKLTQSQIEELIKKCIEAKEFSYSPYSRFRVGASVLTSSGKMVTGCNIESAAYSATICAERTAFVKLISEGHKDIIAVAVSTDLLDQFPTPCGVCRQLMFEFCPKAEVFYTCGPVYRMCLVEDLLPGGFGGDSLNEMAQIHNQTAQQ